ncbi:MAG TPA: DUF423 domain-containing protein [Gammaproteobacteria bacterium]|jgi:uncharacterized membrane protein YgdD (TMEM256/DUF423 family)
MSESTKILLVSGALFAALAVMLGAFGAHGLKKSLSSEMMEVFQTAVDYHFIHALGILLTGLFMLHIPESKPLLWAGISFIAGIILFSGSLYGLSLSEIRKLGMITPIGGLAFIVGWLLMAYGLYRS